MRRFVCVSYCESTEVFRESEHHESKQDPSFQIVPIIPKEWATAGLSDKATTDQHHPKLEIGHALPIIGSYLYSYSGMPPVDLHTSVRFSSRDATSIYTEYGDLYQTVLRQSERVFGRMCTL